MKVYKLRLPDRLKGREEEIAEYLIVEQWKDRILTSGACAIMLGIEKFAFQDVILGKYKVPY